MIGSFRGYWKSMKRRKFIRNCGFAAAGGIVGGGLFAGEGGGRGRPNIVMIVAHDLGRHLGCYGVETVHSANIDALAGKGVRFANYYSTSAVCAPGRGSLHTGRYPQSNGLMGLAHAPWWWRFNEGEKHTAQYLKEAGYETVLIGLSHLGEKAERLGYERHLSRKRRARETTEEAVKLIRERSGGGRPFFAKVGYQEVHRPFTRGEDRSKGVYVPGWLQETEAIREDLARFQSEIRFFDKCVGYIIRAVESSGAGENTLLIVTSEHGIPYPGAKWSVRKAGFENPLIMYMPGSVFSGGKVYEDIMSNVDVLPTLLDYLGLEICDDIEGVSFKAFLEGRSGEVPREAAFAQYTPDMKRDNLSRCVITERFHLIRYFDQGRTVDYPVGVDPELFAAHRARCKTRGRARPFVQLYDIREYPFELNDLGERDEYKGVVKGLSAKLMEWMKRVNDPLLRGPFETPYYEKAMKDLSRAGAEHCAD